MKNYSLTKGIWKSVVAVVVVGGPVFLQLLPTAYLDLTLGGLLMLIINYVKVTYT